MVLMEDMDDNTLFEYHTDVNLDSNEVEITRVSVDVDVGRLFDDAGRCILQFDADKNEEYSYYRTRDSVDDTWEYYWQRRTLDTKDVLESNHVDRGGVVIGIEQYIRDDEFYGEGYFTSVSTERKK